MKKLVILSLMIVSSQAMALISAGLGVGLKNTQFSDDKTTSSLKANEITAYVHVDPIPLIPVSFGLALFSDQYAGDGTFSAMSNFAVAPEVKAWFPFGDIRPYARASYFVYSNYTGKESIFPGQEAKFIYNGLGYRLGVGLTYSILPLIKIFGEYGYSSENAKPKNFSVNDVDMSSGASNLNVSSQTGLLGVEVGI